MKTRLSLILILVKHSYNKITVNEPINLNNRQSVDVIHVRFL
jgi:hypothetical protein